MRRSHILALAGLAVTICSLGALGLQRRDAEEDTKPVYMVTDFPNKSAGRPYRESVEEHLNAAAGRGWRLHSVVSAQGDKMLVFERAPARQD